MERIEDKSKALSYIGIEVADALKLIPTPREEIEETVNTEKIAVEEKVQEQTPISDTQYYEETRVNVKPSLWQRFKQSKFVQTIKYVMKIRIVLDVPALPSGDESKK